MDMTFWVSYNVEKIVHKSHDINYTVHILYLLMHYSLISSKIQAYYQIDGHYITQTFIVKGSKKTLSNSIQTKCF